MASRRSVLIGLGSLVAGGGALLGTGAFTTVEADRTVNVQTTGDASGFLGLEAAVRSDDTGTNPGNTTTDPNENEYVTGGTGETIEINLDGNTEGASGLNQNAITTFRNLVTVTNNGTENVESLTVSISSADGSIGANTFEYIVDDDNVEATVSDGSNLLGASGDDGSITSNLTPGESIDFGMVIDLIDGSLPDSDTDLTLTITAETPSSS